MNESDSLHFPSNIVKPVPAVYATEVHLVTMSGRILVDVSGTLDFGGTNWDVPPAWQSSNSVVLEPGVRLHVRFWVCVLCKLSCACSAALFGAGLRPEAFQMQFRSDPQAFSDSAEVRSTAKHFEGRSLLPQDMQTSARRGFLKSASERK